MKKNSVIYGVVLLTACSIAAFSSFSLTKALTKQNAEAVTLNIGSNMRHISMNVTKDTGMGNAVFLVGDFCSWSAGDANAIKFSWTDGNVWVAEFDIEAGTTYHCKLVNAKESDPYTIWEWEKDGEGNERVITFSTSTTYNFTWGSY